MTRTHAPCSEQTYTICRRRHCLPVQMWAPSPQGSPLTPSTMLCPVSKLRCATRVASLWDFSTSPRSCWEEEGRSVMRPCSPKWMRFSLLGLLWCSHMYGCLGTLGPCMKPGYERVRPSANPPLSSENTILGRPKVRGSLLLNGAVV